ncbi:CGCGG family rSAM-modified RiPP protein [Haloarcula sp. JP-L23]|uniref:CGCGG family putative rSAM-modified RiPP protein n=1 Tax=Haloarcula sp. JP-L23 TaxID=2716717 RepID=UPI00140EA163|nr:CGCGG family rSAM-modified RiPP protein [Haloarcula sp. JP-L23]
MSRAHDDTPSVTDEIHDNSWSANLEGPEHAEDRELVVAQAREAIEKTTAGNHVNLVTHEAHGHPETYLYDPLRERFGDRVDLTYVDQCGCGGYVVRARVSE